MILFHAWKKESPNSKRNWQDRGLLMYVESAVKELHGPRKHLGHEPLRMECHAYSICMCVRNVATMSRNS